MEVRRKGLGRLISVLFGASPLHPFACIPLGDFFLEGRVCAKSVLGGVSRERGEGMESEPEKGRNL